MKETGLCYLRTGEDKGSIVLTPDAVNARYVMLHNGKNGTLYKIKGKGPRFWSKADLEKKGFEGLGHEYYLVYEFDTTRSKQYINIPSLARGKQTTSPWFATWSELMG
jgi:site-specific DNA-methyltransferase (adenine-specific)